MCTGSRSVAVRRQRLLGVNHGERLLPPVRGEWLRVGRHAVAVLNRGGSGGGVAGATFHREMRVDGRVQKTSARPPGILYSSGKSLLIICHCSFFNMCTGYRV